MMPFVHVVELFTHFEEMLPYDAPLVTYALLYLLAIHEGAIVASQSEVWIARLQNLSKKV
jgi:hypothetical protein